MEHAPYDGFMPVIRPQERLAEYISLVYTSCMTTAKLFQNGRSQAVRLPKEFRFEGTQVIVQRCGDGVLLLPEKRSWDALFNSCGKFSSDFFAEGRQQPPLEDRPLLEP